MNAQELHKEVMSKENREEKNVWTDKQSGQGTEANKKKTEDRRTIQREPVVLR